jgi:ATPase family AAA domain-containing protein 3A/B
MKSYSFSTNSFDMSYIFRVFMLLLALFALCDSVSSSSASSDVSLYSDITLINTSDSLQRIKALPIVYYRFLYDSIPDRIQLGVIGPDAAALFPESIEVLPSTAFAQRQQQQSSNSSSKSSNSLLAPITVTNFPVVDKNVIYMHGLSSIQEISHQLSLVQNTTQQLENHSGDYKKEFTSLQAILSSEADKQLYEQLSLLSKELALKDKEIALEEERKQREKEKMFLQLSEEKKLLEYEENLSKERLMKQEEIIRHNLEKQLTIEKQLAERKESLMKENALLQQTIKENQQMELDSKKLSYEKEKISLEMEAKMNTEKLAEEIAIRKLQIQSKLDTERMIEGIKNISNQIISIMKNIFSHPKQLLMIASLIFLLILCYFLIKELSNLIRSFIQSNLGKPLLVRETSYSWSWIPDLKETFSSIFQKKENAFNATLKTLEEEYRHIILSKDDKERIINLTLATKNTKASGAPYRHVLLFGPPGNGKTLIARKLAQCSGMDYAILSGGDVAPLGEDAVTQLHSLFRWAKKSKKGLLVFIDEAEAFLSSRNHMFGNSSSSGGDKGAGAGGGGNISSDTHIRNALNALLYQTGTPSTHFMMILATNRPEDLDSAILDRIDVSIQISLPKYQQRIDLISLYSHLHIYQMIEEKTIRNIVLKGIYRFFGFSLSSYCIENNFLQNHEILLFISKYINGFSGREISKLFISIQYELFLSSNGILTWNACRELIKSKIIEHTIKRYGFNTRKIELSTSYSSGMNGGGGRGGYHEDLSSFDAEDPLAAKKASPSSFKQTGNKQQQMATSSSTPTTVEETSVEGSIDPDFDDTYPVESTIRRPQSQISKNTIHLAKVIPSPARNNKPNKK